MLPFLYDREELPFDNLDFIFIPGIRTAVETKQTVIKAYAVKDTPVSYTHLDVYKRQPCSRPEAIHPVNHIW